MSNAKNMTVAVSAALALISAVGTFIVPELKFGHLPYHMFIIVVLLLVTELEVKDLFIVIMIFSSVIWFTGFFNILKDTYQLLFETVMIISVSGIIGVEQAKSKNERGRIGTIIAYKRKEVAGLRDKINEVKSRNDEVVREINKFRGMFA